jgi:hypothetical protein
MANKNRLLFLRLVLLAYVILHLEACPSPTSPHTRRNDPPVLPLDLILEPDPGFKGGFTIREADGFALVGKGVSYRDIDLQVEVLVGYGVHPSALAAEVIDSEGKTKFIRVVKQSGPSCNPFR